MIIRLLGALGRSGGSRPRMIDPRRDRAAAATTGIASARNAPIVATALVIVVVMLVVFDIGARGSSMRDDETQGLGARDYAALPKAEKDCFERLGPKAEWRLLDRCRATEARDGGRDDDGAGGDGAGGDGPDAGEERR